MKLSIATLFLIVADVAVGRQLLDDDCTLYAVGDTRLRGKHRSKTHSSSELDFVCEPNGLGAQGNSGTQGSYHINLTKAQKKFLQNGMNNGSVVSGLTTLQGAYYEDNEIVISENTTFGRKEEEPKVLSKQKSILVVRVTDKDGKVIRDSAAQVGDNVFGTISDPVNLKSQMYDCSYGAVDITNEYNSPNIDDKLSAPGVLDVTIPISINGNRYTVHNAVTKAAEAKLGYKLPGQHEQVMYVLEKCYQNCGWAAYAYINSWLSVYQDRYYLQTGVQMHEIGHNLGMAHSGGLNGQAYTDHTCLMGNPLYSDDVGKMCFNPAKNWYLNWYNDYKTTVDITVPNISKKITMVGIAEIKVNNPNKMPAVLKLETGTTNDYFVGFNRATGINSQNDEADDEVTIVQTGNNGESYSQSYLKATLKQGESYSIGELKITATAIDIRKRPGTAIVTLVKGKQEREIFYIRNPATGKYLDVRGARCHDGNPLILYQFNGSVAQQFYFGPNGSIMNAGCNKPLDIRGGSCNAGAILQMWAYHGGSNQQFEVRGREIWNRRCNKAIDNYGGRNQNYNPIIMWNPHKGGPQQWEIVKKQKQGTYLIKSYHGTKIRIYNYNKVDMTVNEGSWERITIVPVGNGQYALKSTAHGNRYLRVPGRGPYRTINTQTFVGGWEKFYIIDLQNGKVAFKSAQWGNYLRANRGNNVRLDTQTYIGGWEQFTLIAK